MLPDRVTNPGPLTYQSGALPIALRGPARRVKFLKHEILRDNLTCFMLNMDSFCHFPEIMWYSNIFVSAL